MTLCFLSKSVSLLFHLSWPHRSPCKDLAMLASLRTTDDFHVLQAVFIIEVLTTQSIGVPIVTTRTISDFDVSILQFESQPYQPSVQLTTG